MSVTKQITINQLYNEYMTCPSFEQGEKLIHEMSIHASRYIVKRTGIEQNLALSYAYEALDLAFKHYDADNRMSFSSFYLMKCKNSIREIRRTELGTRPYVPFRDDTPVFMVGDDAFALIQDSTNLEKESMMVELLKSGQFSKKEITSITKIMDGYKVTLPEPTIAKLENFI